MSANPMPHLVLAFARCASDAWLPAMRALPEGGLRHLGKLLQGMKLVQTDAGDAHSLSTPHERVLALAHGIVGLDVVDGLIPWAAQQAAFNAATASLAGKAWAYITPCHWAMGREHATLTDPAALQLGRDDMHTLMLAMQPYFETEGITLYAPGAAQTTHWLAEGEVFRHLPTASLDRVLGRNVDKWLPASRAIKLLQNEMQMLLYTHPLNDARSARQLPTVNSFWLSGTGALSQPVAAIATTASVSGSLVAPRNLAQAVFADDWSAYANAWQTLDANDIAAWLTRQSAGEKLKLTLCSESTAETFEHAENGFFAKLKSVLSPRSALNLLEQL